MPLTLRNLAYYYHLPSQPFLNFLLDIIVCVLLEQSYIPPVLGLRTTSKTSTSPPEQQVLFSELLQEMFICFKHSITPARDSFCNIDAFGCAGFLPILLDSGYCCSTTR